MPHRSHFFSSLPGGAGESKQDDVLGPKGWKFYPRTRNSEKPAKEMGRLIRVIAGTAIAGEKDAQLIDRAVHRMNQGLEAFQQVSGRTGRSYWYEEIEKVPSHHMDRARELAFVAPIEGALIAVETAERFLDGLRERLLDRAVGDSGGHGRDAAEVRRARMPRGSAGHGMGGNSRASDLDGSSLVRLRHLSAE